MIGRRDALTKRLRRVRQRPQLLGDGGGPILDRLRCNDPGVEEGVAYSGSDARRRQPQANLTIRRLQGVDRLQHARTRCPPRREHRSVWWRDG